MWNPINSKLVINEIIITVFNKWLIYSKRSKKGHLLKNKSSSKLRKIIIFFLVSLLFKPIWLFNNQDLGKPGNDDLSHWLHSATLVYDFDINYEDDYEVELGTFNYETNTPYHPPGAGYLSAPFVFLFSILDKVEPERLNPVGSFAYLGYFAASLFY